ncbi:hypothetical protein [Nocardia sp. alder85J]|uniref:hypothetical protein n=1 Tax=Nocardia sp. alder85J TaxID=2862949 RepID=UPI001CD2FB81|nr:hypothetical protein [Nocardia sp. alder85J]MCX4094920.1 hypothetical protein [Nocardia sp. alder85J]
MQMVLVVFGGLMVLCASAVWLSFKPPAGAHTAPEHVFTVSEAHRAMQRHRGCSRDDCPRKEAAFRVLVESGRVRPDSGRLY